MIGIGFDFEDFSYLIHRIMFFSDSYPQSNMFMVCKSTWNTHHTLNIISRPIQQWHWHTSWIHGTYRCWGWRQAYSSPRWPIALQSKLGIPLPQYAQEQLIGLVTLSKKLSLCISTTSTYYTILLKGNYGEDIRAQVISVTLSLK